MNPSGNGSIFASRSWYTDDHGESRVDMSPLIDCVFILLIFFIVTTAFVDERGIEASKPQGGPASLSNEKSIVIEVVDHQRLLIDGRAADAGSLRTTLAGHLAAHPSTSWLVCPKSGATAGALVEVIDVLNLAGAKRVFVGRSQ